MTSVISRLRTHPPRPPPPRSHIYTEIELLILDSPRPHPPRSRMYTEITFLRPHSPPSPPFSLTHVHRWIGYHNPTCHSLSKFVRLTYLSVHDIRDRASETTPSLSPPFRKIKPSPQQHDRFGRSNLMQSVLRDSPWCLFKKRSQVQSLALQEIVRWSSRSDCFHPPHSEHLGSLVRRFSALVFLAHVSWFFVISLIVRLMSLVLPEESDQFRYLHTVCLPHLKWSVGLMKFVLVKWSTLSQTPCDSTPPCPNFKLTSVLWVDLHMIPLMSLSTWQVFWRLSKSWRVDILSSASVRSEEPRDPRRSNRPACHTVPRRNRNVR